MTYAKQLFLTELPIATTAQIDKGIKQLEALFSEYEEYPGSSDFLDAAKTILKDQMMFASACPFVPYLEAAEKYATYGFDEETYEKIMWKNAAKVLGLEV